MSSRAAFILAQTYMPDWIAHRVGRTNRGHTPLAAILTCSFLGFVSLLGFVNDEYAQVIVARILSLSF